MELPDLRMLCLYDLESRRDKGQRIADLMRDHGDGGVVVLEEL